MFHHFPSFSIIFHGKDIKSSHSPQPMNPDEPAGLGFAREPPGQRTQTHAKHLSNRGPGWPSGWLGVKTHHFLDGNSLRNRIYCLLN